MGSGWPEGECRPDGVDDKSKGVAKRFFHARPKNADGPYSFEKKKIAIGPRVVV
jgi:hypothetical protein